MNKEKLIDALEIMLSQPEELEVLLRKFLHRLKTSDDQRTPSQNNALHLGLTMLAQALNDAGLPMQKVLKPSVEIEWDMESVKKYLFKPILQARYGKDSTTKLKKIGELEVVWETMFRFLGEKFGLEYIEFPSDPSVLKDNH